jgi:hypothetical protein
MAKKPEGEPPARNVTRDKYDALRMLDVTREQLASVPQISTILKKAGIEHSVWNFLEASDHPDAREILKHRASLNEHMQAVCPIEALCIAGKISPKEMLKLIMGEVFEQSTASSRLLAAAAHTDVVQSTLMYAHTPDGSREREMILKHSGFLPVPKSQAVFIHGNQTNIGAQNNVVAVLPPAEDLVKDLSNRFAEKLLPEPEDVASTEVIEVDDEEDLGDDE